MNDKTKSFDYHLRGKKKIPGLTQLLSKRPEMFAPNQWPCHFKRASGANIWDLDDNKYLDMSISGIGANVLGYADQDVDHAVRKAIELGTSTSLNCPEEVDLAELLCEIHPWAQMVRYARTGGESMSIAVRIGRAHSQKDKVAFCGYHGWHDWYLAANLSHNKNLDDHLLPGLESKGVPRGLQGTAIPFEYNNLDSLKKIFNDNKNEVGVVVMEPLRNFQPKEGFLEGVKNLAHENGAILIFDEITAAFRENSGCYHLLFDIVPDIAVMAKAISNGYPMAAIIGTEKVMQSAQDTFISSTYWTDRIGPTAALATIKKHKDKNVGKHLKELGQLVQKGWKKAAIENDLKIHVSGLPSLSHFHFQEENSRELMTLYVQEMLKKGILAGGRFYTNYSHTKENVELYIKETKEAFGLIKRAQQDQVLTKLLEGPIAHNGFQRLN